MGEGVGAGQREESVGEPRHRSSARAWAPLALLATIALGCATLGLSTSGAQTSFRLTSPASSHGLPARPVESGRAPGAQSAELTGLALAAPGTRVNGGANQSDPFLTVESGRYLLLTSGGTGSQAVNVPVATSTDFIVWTEPVDALPVLPAWAQPGFTWAPDLHRFGSHYVLYFTSVIKNYAPETQCIGSAIADSPTGPFTARPMPIICQLDQGGSIDPRVFVNSDGTPWMLWKSDQNIGGSTTPTKLWSQRLSADGMTLLGSPSFLMSPDQPWQGTIVEAPDMIELNGSYWVVYSANWYNHPEYAIGAARCAGPAGPCHDDTSFPLLSTNFQGEGPGEASLFHNAAGVWMLYSPWRSLAPNPDIPARPVFITRLGYDLHGLYLAAGPLPSAVDLLGQPFWSPTS